MAVPSRKRLLLVLPQGDKFDYTCTKYGSVCGDNLEKALPPAPRRML